MSVGSIQAGRAEVTISADSSRFKRGLKDSEHRLKTTGSRLGTMAKSIGTSVGVGLAGAGAAGVAVLGREVKETIGQLYELDTTLNALGMDKELGSGLLRSLDQLSGGGKMREITEGMLTMTQRINQAANGEGGQGGKLFEQLKLDAQEIKKLDPSEQFLRIHEAIKQLEGADQASALLGMFGEDTGKDLLKTLSMSNEELRGMADSLSLTSEGLESASAAQEAMNSLSMAWNETMGELAVTVAPMFEGIALAITDVLNGFTDLTTATDFFMAGLANIASYIETGVMGTFYQLQEAVLKIFSRIINAYAKVMAFVTGQDEGEIKKAFGMGIGEVNNVLGKFGMKSDVLSDQTDLMSGKITQEEFDRRREANTESKMAELGQKSLDASKQWSDAIQKHRKVVKEEEKVKDKEEEKGPTLWETIGEWGMDALNKVNDFNNSPVAKAEELTKSQYQVASAAVVGSAEAERKLDMAMNQPVGSSIEDKQLKELKDIEKGIKRIGTGIIQVIAGNGV